MAKQYNYELRPGETLNELYNRLAKTSDQRMLRMERLAEKEEGFKTAKQWAYARAQKDIEKYGELRPGQKPRFNTKPPENESQLRAKINDMQTFLASPTSTKSGIVNVYKKRAETVNKKYGTNFTWEDLAKYYLQGQNKKYEKFAASQTILIAIGKIQNASEEELKDWTRKTWNTRQKGNKKDYRIDPDDPIMDQTIKRLLRSKALKEYL